MLRDDISVIDQASSILSMNNGRYGKAISIKTDYLEKMTVKTPVTAHSQTKSSMKSTISEVKSTRS